MPPSIKSWLAKRTVATHLHACRLVQQLQIAVAARDPMHTQRKLLRAILAQNANTAFGRQFGFSTIGDYTEFARRIPVADYEALRPYVTEQIEHGVATLTDEAPLRYVRTSGTTGLPKDLPLTRSHIRALRRINRTALAFQQRACPKAFSGSILAIVSPAEEATLSNGVPFGSASGVLARSVPNIIKDKFVLPPEVLSIPDSHLRYLLILRLAMARSDLSYIGAANPSTLLILSKLYREHHVELINDLHSGSFCLLKALSADVVRAIGPQLRADPIRALELSGFHQRADTARLADLWPALQLVVTWTCASAGIAVDALRRELPATTRILELGYIASEFRGTITLGDQADSGWPTLDTHFFEFVEREKWDRGEPEYQTLEGIREGINYYIVVTTPSGLYRYFINDLVRVTGFLRKTPLLKFVQKGKGVTNITGEKLYESQVLAAVRLALDQIGRTASFVMMLADEKTRGYQLYVEPDQGCRPDATVLAGLVDRELAVLNIEYRGKRESSRLEPIQAHWLRADAGEDYKQFCVRQGQREGQFKTIALAYQKDFAFDIALAVDEA